MPPVVSIYDRLVASAVFNSSNLVLRPISLNSTASLEKETNVNDTTYQNELLYRVRYDGLSPAQTIITDAMTAMRGLLTNTTAFANITEIANVSLVSDISMASSD